ncbi:LeoA/HP0731 family dynamin-like GTPase [Helicobacter typhlonius]|uniref:LeoA/HP0731 family dynamin-like GTPase n=1 Tax=Helicobacter typhlonius TaxID=76936 RepID=UPI002FDF754E
MTNTIQSFKEQQSKALETCKNLLAFLEKGKEIEVFIDENLINKLLRTISEIDSKKLKVALVGGFSEGKTSIAAAWLERLDKSSMKISHEESSDMLAIYELGDDIELIDTPGLFGFKEKHSGANVEKYKDITRKYISEAHLLLYVMNAANPIKESHKDDLNWLFRTLNLLPRTIFVLSKFDEVVDIEEQDSYQEALKIKKESITKRLSDLIELSNKECETLSIVAVAANPLDKGFEHWQQNMQEFKALSHIESLQNATQEKIITNGGFELIVLESIKSIIADVIHKQLPLITDENENISQAKIRFIEGTKHLQSDMKRLEENISESRRSLRNFATNYFTDLILQLQGTSLKTFGEFFEREIGSEGIILNTRIQNEFDKQTEYVHLEFQKIATHFEAKIDTFSKFINTAGKEGLGYIQKSGIINANNVKIVRDSMVNFGKIVGVDLTQALKFQPWGAVKLAKGANVAVAVAGIAFELWDSYKQYEKEQELQKVKDGIKENLEGQRKEILELVNGESFIETFFKNYMQLKDKYIEINNEMGGYRIQTTNI